MKKRSIRLSYQHGGAQVKLLGQLGDVDVDRHQLQGVHLLHLAYDVRHPLKLPLGPRHPDEVNLHKKETLDLFRTSGMLWWNISVW